MIGPPQLCSTIITDRRPRCRATTAGIDRGLKLAAMDAHSSHRRNLSTCPRRLGTANTLFAQDMLPVSAKSGSTGRTWAGITSGAPNARLSFLATESQQTNRSTTTTSQRLKQRSGLCRQPYRQHHLPTWILRSRHLIAKRSQLNCSKWKAIYRCQRVSLRRCSQALILPSCEDELANYGFLVAATQG